MMKGNLLIVDDELMLLDCLKAVLEKYTDETFTAVDGVKAYEIIKTKEIHCVVSDINMPAMNGLELIKRLREENFNMPFIFCSGHGGNNLMLEAAKYGAYDFIDKPILQGLNESVRRALAIGTNSQPGPNTDEFITDYKRLLKKREKSSL